MLRGPHPISGDDLWPSIASATDPIKGFKNAALIRVVEATAVILHGNSNFSFTRARIVKKGRDIDLAARAAILHGRRYWTT